MRRIIYSVSVGYDNCFKHCIESQKNYAEKLKADFFVRTSWQNWNDDLQTDSEKRYVVELLKYYDKVLYLDGDVLIKDQEVDIFKEYENDNNLIIYNEVSANGVQMDSSIQELVNKHNITWPKTNGHYDWLNAGVMLFARGQGHELALNYYRREFFKMENMPMIFDMPYMHYNIFKYGIKYTPMQERFNTMIYFHDKGNFLHFANVSDRQTRINDYVQCNCNNGVN